MKKEVPNSLIFILVATRKILLIYSRTAISLTYTDQIKTTGSFKNHENPNPWEGGGDSCIHTTFTGFPKSGGGGCKLHGSSEKFWLCQKVCMPRDEL